VFGESTAQQLYVGRNATRTTGADEPEVDAATPSARWMEDVAMGWTGHTQTPSSTVQSPMEIRSQSQSRPVLQQQQILPGIAELSSPTLRASTEIALPPKALTLAYLEHNLARINALTMVLDTSVVLEMAHDLYYKQESGQRMDTNDLGLFFSVLSSGLHYWPPVNITDLLSMKESIASTAVKLLEENQATRTPSLSLLQAMLVFMPILLTRSGTYLTQGGCHERMISIARSLSLSRIDIKANQEANKNNPHATEIRRRVWWFITATDWILSHMSGPQEYAYSIHPNHMKVNFPKNIDIEDWEIRSGVEKPLSEPTQMTYFIMRSRLSLVCKDVADTLAQNNFDGNEPDYQIMIDLDQRLQDYLSELPDYFRLQPKDRALCEQLERQYPYVLWQRSLLQIGVHTRICRLHQPYMKRGTTMPMYSYSRMACLRSARLVLETVERVIDGELVEAPVFIRIWTVLHHTFLAAVMLLTDFVQNPREPGVGHRKREIERAVAILGRVKDESDIARKGWEILSEGLRKFGGGDGNIRGSERAMESPNGSDKNAYATEHRLFEPDTSSNLWTKWGDEIAMDENFWTTVYLDLDQFIVD